MLARKVSAIFFWILSVLALLWVTDFGWGLRDGLGPDSVETHGLAALGAALLNGIIAGLVFLVVPLLVAGRLLYPRKYKCGRGKVVFLSAYLGVSLCTFISNWIFEHPTRYMDLGWIFEHPTRYMDLGEQAVGLYADVVYGIYVVFGMYPGLFTPEWYAELGGIIGGAIIGAIVGSLLTRNHNLKEPVNGT